MNWSTYNRFKNEPNAWADVDPEILDRAYDIVQNVTDLLPSLTQRQVKSFYGWLLDPLKEHGVFDPIKEEVEGEPVLTAEQIKEALAS